MNKQDFENLASIRLTEVRLLLDNHQYSGAYYLSGYVVECALKACIAKRTQQYDFPDKKTVEDSHTHDLTKLIKVAGLDSELQSKLSDPNFQAKWLVVGQWSEKTRYAIHSEQSAIDIYAAINDNHGILQWLQQHW